MNPFLSTINLPECDVPTAAGLLRHLPFDPRFERSLRLAGHGEDLDAMEGLRAYRTDSGILVQASRNHTHHGTLLHVSISRRDRHPTWGEIKAIRECFFDADIDVVMMMPRRADYVNVHEHCFHLWESPIVWGIR